MFKFETVDPKVAQRFRVAQYNGKHAAVETDGATITGLVRSVVEREARDPTRWTISIVPMSSKVKQA
ncbi:hypothetical protein [Bradyrhizobium sp.]|uniref:hypothetical protein n=1 Tax=Bradyrhizobium sp. TaxID=376 RepID=UPI003C3E7B71